MHGDRVIRLVADRIRFVVPDRKPALPQEVADAAGEAWIALVEDPALPGPRHALEYRREAVQREEHGRAGRVLPRVQLAGDAPVIGLEDLAPARLSCLRAQPRIAGDRRGPPRLDAPAPRRRGARAADSTPPT